MLSDPLGHRGDKRILSEDQDLIPVTPNDPLLTVDPISKVLVSSLVHIYELHKSMKHGRDNAFL